MSLSVRNEDGLVLEGCLERSTECIEYSMQNNVSQALFCEKVQGNFSCTCGIFMGRMSQNSTNGDIGCAFQDSAVPTIAFVTVILILVVSAFYWMRCLLCLVTIAFEKNSFSMCAKLPYGSESRISRNKASLQTSEGASKLSTGGATSRQSVVRWNRSNSRYQGTILATLTLCGISFAVITSWAVVYVLLFQNSEVHFNSQVYPLYLTLNTLANVFSVSSSISVAVVLIHVIAEISKISRVTSIIKTVAKYSNIVYILYQVFKYVTRYQYHDRRISVIASSVMSMVLMLVMATTYYEAKTQLKRFQLLTVPAQSSETTRDRNSSSKALRNVRSFVLKFTMAYLVFVVLQLSIPRINVLRIPVPLTAIVYANTLVYGYAERTAGIKFRESPLASRRKTRKSTKQALQESSGESSCGTLTS